MKKEFIKSHFLDSGAFSLHRKSFIIQKGKKLRGEEFFNTKEFWDYIDAYASFIKKYKIAIDLYANVDVIGNPKLTWRNQKYLENKHGLKPVPVIHFGTDLEWLKKYIDKGYIYIGLGGLVGNSQNKYCTEWVDRCFNLICDTPKNLPCMKVHGFGVNDPLRLFRYPWWSVDATNAEKLGRYGKIMIPRKSKGVYDYRKKNYIVALSKRVKKHSLNINYKSMNPLIRKTIQEWLDFINNSKKFNQSLKFENNEEYKIANFFYYEQLRKALPKYPWSFKIKMKRTLL